MSKLNELRMIDDLRLLSLDMINNADSGHPGICLSAAPMIYTLFANHMVYDLERPNWCNRDRFVLSAGHGSALLYATIYATTEDFTLDDLKKFRHVNSQTPGHPELNINKRIEATTGALGQGFATAVGLAVAEKHLESKYNTKKLTLFNYNIYCLCSDGDLMEGISYEAASIAGEYKLNNLIVLYDANKMTLDGALDKDYNDRIADMYVALGWDVLVVKNGDKVSEIDKALDAANKNKQPTLIIVNTILGKNSQYENTNQIHSKLDEDDLNQIRIKLKGKGPFEIDEDNLKALRKEVKLRNEDAYSEWYKDYQEYINIAKDSDVEHLNELINDEDIILDLEKVIDKEKLFLDKSMRDINFQVMNVISAFIDRFIGGSADLSSSTKTYLKNGGNYGVDNYQNKNIAFGVRENAMGAILNGIALTNIRCFGSTFLTFADYLKPSIRNTAIMNLPVTYIFTHDSFLIGQDGKTHQPIEQLAMLRSIPNLDVYRPCDYKELIGAWQLILKNKKPSALIISKEPTESYKYTSIEETALGGYVISEVKNRLDVILIASGREVTLAMKLKQELLKSFIEARIVSMPNINEFFKQSKEYQNQVLPKGYKRMVIEFSNDPTLYRLVKNEDDIININTFGKSGTKEELLAEFELDIASIVIKIKNSI
ncbi:MAG: transketolase-like TK C-terminal-containing protein [Bacilli bacterium]